jgi:hypothetical protein
MGLIDVELEKQLAVRNIPPGGRLSLPARPFNGLLKTRRASVYLQYDATVQGSTRMFTSEYKFVLPDGQLVGQSIDPVGWDRQHGPIEKIAGDFQIDKLLSSLYLPIATVILDLPERRPDGSVNFTEIRNDNRRFIFDPEKRNASFSIQYSPGFRRTLQAELARSSTGMHRVAFSWDDTKHEINLAADGNAALAK